MRKLELTKLLIEHLTEKHLQLTEHAVKESVTALILRIIEVLSQGGRMEIRGFGSLGSSYYAAFKARNPKTDDIIDVPSRFRPYFKPAKKLKLRLNASYR